MRRQHLARLQLVRHPPIGALHHLAQVVVLDQELVVAVLHRPAHRVERRGLERLDQRRPVADLAAQLLDGRIHVHHHVVRKRRVQRRITAVVGLAELGDELLIGRIGQVVRIGRRIEQADHGVAHGRDDVLIGSERRGDQRDVLVQARGHELLDEVDAHAAGLEDVDRFGLGRAQLGQLGGEVQLPDLGVDLVGQRLLVQALEAVERVLARGVVGRHDHDLVVALVRGVLARGLVHGVVLVAGAEEIGIALGARELAGAGVGRQVGHLGGKQRRAHGQRHVGGHRAGEQIDLLALDEAVYELACLLGVARHVGLDELGRHAAELAAQQLDGQVQAVADLGAGCRERAGDIQGHAHLDGRGRLRLGQHGRRTHGQRGNTLEKPRSRYSSHCDPLDLNL